MLKLKCSCIAWRRATKEQSHENVSNYYLYTSIVIVLSPKKREILLNHIFLTQPFFFSCHFFACSDHIRPWTIRARDCADKETVKGYSLKVSI